MIFDFGSLPKFPLEVGASCTNLFFYVKYLVEKIFSSIFVAIFNFSNTIKKNWPIDLDIYLMNK